MLFDLLTFSLECTGGHLSILEFADIWCGFLIYVVAIALWVVILGAIGSLSWLISKVG